MASLGRHSDASAPVLLTAALVLCLAAATTRAASSASLPASLTKAQGEQLFAQRINPLLGSKCHSCHGEDPKKLKGDLDLRTREGLLKPGKSGVVLVPGDAAKSLLYVAVTRTNEDLQMPPKDNDRLSPEDINLVRLWIAAGAPWPDAQRTAELAKQSPGPWGSHAGVTVATTGGLTPKWTQRKYEPINLWAYQPVRKPDVPVAFLSPSAARPNPIDAFINRRLHELGLKPAPPADRRTLIRRVTYDLLGLPPTPAEVAAFVADPSPDDQAFARVVDRLLASPHYGEQWGRHWLDVVRYADSSGLANDFDRPNTWRYRDYVIRAFNEDKPYDQFVREQIAGDEINPRNPEMLVAVGFLRMGPWELTGMEVAKVARQHYLDDVTEGVGHVFLSHPLECSRCHDHKFDPIPMRDFYRLQAVFSTTQFAERTAPFLPEENTNGFDEVKYLKARQRRYQAVLDGLRDKEEAAGRKWCAERGLPYIPRTKGLKQGIPEAKLPPRKIGFSVEDFGLERIARKGLERLKWELDRYKPYAFSVYSGRTPTMKAVLAPLHMPAHPRTEGELEKPAILALGNPFSRIADVTPGVLSMLPGSNDTVKKTAFNSIPNTISGRRRALADWIASPKNTLTARSLVNRVWLWHFGRAIAGNPNNFGAMGQKPTHPELLDWLAATFVEKGWTIKALHRIILFSEAYRRSATHPNETEVHAKDPQGVSYAVFQPRRLIAEEIRDSMLDISGELNPELGGIPIRPEINLQVALQPRQVMGTFASAWQPSPLPEERHRRSIYALRIRGLRDPVMEVFNQPDPEASCERRQASTVTPQVFSLFNSEDSYDRALAFAARLRRESSDPARNIQRAFELVYGRQPIAAEAQACQRHWQTMTERHRHLTFPKPAYAEEVVREALEENSGERFKFSEKLDVYADFVPDLKPADVDAETRGLAEVCLVLFNSNEFIYVY